MVAEALQTQQHFVTSVTLSCGTILFMVIGPSGHVDGLTHFLCSGDAITWLLCVKHVSYLDLAWTLISGQIMHDEWSINSALGDSYRKC